MFHDSHDLNRIVADLLDARQDVVGERPVSVDLALGRTEGIRGLLCLVVIELNLLLLLFRGLAGAKISEY